MKHQTRKVVPPSPIVPRGTLAAAFATIGDPRQPFGWRPDRPPLPLVAILLLTVAAVLAGANGLTAIAQWGQERLADQPDLLHALGFPAGHSPAPSTLHRLYRRLDQQAVARAIGSWLATMGLTAVDHVAVDGRPCGRWRPVRFLAVMG